MTLGVFTTIKIQNGIPLFWSSHLKRISSQAEKLNVGPVLLSFGRVKTYLKQNNVSNCALKIIATKENGKTEIIYKTRPLPQNFTSCKVITVEDTRNYLKIYKTTNRAINENAKKQAEEKSADDALFTLNSNIVESTISNVFGINKNGELITPPIKAKGLGGITRQLIMKQTTVTETDINQNTKGPLVLVNCLRVQKVTHINGKKLIDGERLLQKMKTIIEQNEKDYVSQINL